MPDAGDKQTQGTPAWWLARLEKAMAARSADLRRYDDYYSGRHPLAFASRQFKEEFRGLFDDFADNWCDLVVDAVEERLTVRGFRIGTETDARGLVKADDDAWRIWQENGLDALSKIAHMESLINGEAYVLVSPFEADFVGDGTPRVTIEHPRQMIVATTPGSYGYGRDAALKKWIDDDGYAYSTLYLPDAIWKFRSRTKVNDSSPDALGEVHWEPRTGQPDDIVTNPIGVVPVVPLRNKPRLLTPSTSEIAKVIPLQNAINKLFIDMLVASEFAAFRQRYVIGLDLEIDEKTNEPKNPFRSRLDRFLVIEGSAEDEQDVSIGDLEASDLRNYITPIETGVQHVASQSRTPPHYFYLKGQMPSGESIKSAETGLVAKTVGKQIFFGEAWEEVIRLCFAVKRDARSKILTGETIWKDPESRTEGEHVDSVLKKGSPTIGVPQEQLWEDLGYSPQQIKRFKAMQAEESLRIAQGFSIPRLRALPGGAEGEVPPAEDPGAADAG